MASGGGLTATPLQSGSHFNWVFLVELLTSAILTIFFLFYFNRLFGTLVSYAIRAYTWRAYRAYIDIQALRISFLGGRIFFKGVRYHAHNETIVVHGGFITWRYWLRNVRDAEVYSTPSREERESRGDKEGKEDQSGDSEEKGGPQANKSLLCRLDIKVSGVESFIYNRSPVYDAIIENVARASTKAEDIQREFKLPEKDGPSSPQDSVASGDGEVVGVDSLGPAQSAEKSTNAVYHKQALPGFLKLFPIHVECNGAAVVLGNENTRSILTVKIDKADGVFEAAHAACPLDVYRQIFQFDVDHPVVTIKPNTDFKEFQLKTAARLKKEALNGPVEMPGRSQRILQSSRRAWHVLERLSPSFRKSAESLVAAVEKAKFQTGNNMPPIPGQERWLGLSRYLDEKQRNEHDKWEAVEYAKSSTIADLSKVGLAFYWDVPGQVAGFTDDLQTRVKLEPNDPNGTTPPAYGMDLHIYSGTVNYGPWADRMRTDFQNIFFPAVYTDAEPMKRLSPGQYRLNSVLKVFLCIEEDLTLRIPFRESSKDWKWKGQAEGMATKKEKDEKPKSAKSKGRMRFLHRDQGPAAPTLRPFGWLDIKVFKDTTISYTGDMYARKKGFFNSLNADIRGTETHSSVNHGLLWRSGTFGLDCDISNPLGWQTTRHWRFDILSKDLEVFILRDHLFMLTDLALDWSSGPPSDYFTFVPYTYRLNLDIRDLKLCLNTNDANIISEPSSLEDNSYIILYGGRLLGDVSIPLDRYRPTKRSIPYDFKGFDFGLDMSMPPKSTLSAFAQNRKFATLEEFTLAGSFTGSTATSIANTDMLTFDIHGSKLIVLFYGFLAHHLIRVKENYFGDDVHFRTMEEYQQLVADGGANPDHDGDQISNRGNDLDVILNITVDDASAVLPANIYNAADNVTIDVPYATVDLQMTSYFMDLMLNLSPISISLGNSIFELEVPQNSVGRTQVFVDSVQLMGSRLIGLAQVESSYFCNWDVDVGNISGECSDEFLTVFARAVQAAIVAFPDAENTLPVAPPIPIHDVQFLQLRTRSIHLWLHVKQDALLIDLQNTTIEFNDWAQALFSGRVSIGMPELTIACVDCSSLQRHSLPSAQRRPVKTNAYLKTSVSLNVLLRKRDFDNERKAQQTHIRRHDQRTNRAQFLLLPGDVFNEDTDQTPDSKVEPPAMIFPYPPGPIQVEQLSSSASSSDDVFSNVSRGRSTRSTVALSSFSRKHALRTKASRASFAESISGASAKGRNPLRRRSAHSAASQQPSTTYVAPEFMASGVGNTATTDDYTNRAAADHFSVIYSSPLSAPILAMDSWDLDLSELPLLPKEPDVAPKKTGDANLDFNDRTTGIFDDAFVHTSLVMSVNTGLNGFASPGVISLGLNLLRLLQPRRPEDFLDALYSSTLGRINANEDKSHEVGSSLDLVLKVPGVAFRYVNPFQTGRDQFDLEMSPTTVSLRTVAMPADRQERNQLLLHVVLDHLGVSLREVPKNRSDDLAIQIHIDDILVWLAQKGTLSINVAYKGLQIGSSSRKMQYLADLVDRYWMLRQQVASDVQSIQQEQEQRLRYLAHTLTMASNNVPDPLFLTRISFAMRSDHGHLRQHDSWKIISRFRCMYLSLSKESHELLSETLTGPSFDLPPDAQQAVMDAWDRWRTWDLSQVKNSVAMRLIYGDEKMVPEATAKQSLPVELSVRSRKTGLIVDPGPKQSKFSINDLVLALSIEPPSVPSGLKLTTEDPQTSIRVQIASKAVKLHLNWQIWELVESMTQFVLHNETYKAKLFSQDRPDAPLSTRVPSTGQALHVVVAVDAAILSIDTINLTSMSIAEDLKLSLVELTSGGLHPSKSITALIHAKTATADIHGNSHHLLHLQSRAPSLFVTAEPSAIAGHDEDVIKVIGSTEFTSAQGKEEILGLVEIVDAVIRDEAAYIQQQVDGFKRLRSQEPTSPLTITQPPKISKLTVALIVDQYEIELALLQSLTYSLAGSVGRFSVQPDSHRKMAFKIDLDLEQHQHFLRSNEHAKHDIAALTMPRINAQILVSQRARIPVVGASIITEMIELDASALHGLFDTFRRPELSKTFKTIKDDIATVQRNVEHIFPAHERHQPVITDSKPGTEYHVKAILAGIKIVAETHGSRANRSAAKLTIGLSSTRVIASNIPRSGSALYPIPEIHASVRQVYAEITVADQRGPRHCGDVSVGASVDCTVRFDKGGFARHDFAVRSESLSVNLFADTASAVVDVVNHLFDRIKDLDLSRERRYLKRLQRLRRGTIAVPSPSRPSDGGDDEHSDVSGALFVSSLSLKFLNICVRWVVGKSVEALGDYRGEDLVFSIGTIDLATESENTAHLAILDMQLALASPSVQTAAGGRSWNSALLPEVVFNVAHKSGPKERSLWFHAAGKPFDIQLEPSFMLPVSMVQRSITLAVKKFQDASSTWQRTPTSTGTPRKNPFGNKRLASLLIGVDFAGATLHLLDKKAAQKDRGSILLPGGQQQRRGKYEQFVEGTSNAGASVRSPGMAVKLQYTDPPDARPSLNLEMRLDASSNTLYPTIVPLIIEISDTIKEVVQETDLPTPKEPLKPPQKFLEDSEIFTAGPSAMLGTVQLNLGFRICKQEFSLSCQPIARVAATAQFKDIYITVNSVRSIDSNHFFALSTAIEGLQASVQHDYSRESTFNFDADSIVLSLINSKHISGTPGMSAILKISPMRTHLNVRQMQDFFLFREIWFPQEIRSNVPETAAASAKTTAAPEEYLVQRFQQVSAAAAFPWTATVSIEEMAVDLDLGQAIRRSSLKIKDLWASSKKNSDWEQNLCIGIGYIGVDSSGRTSGLVSLEQFRVRTTITWPDKGQEAGLKKVPRIQASAGFDRLRLKAAFDYQAFAIADITDFDVMMYNVLVDQGLQSDRLVAILNGGDVRAYITATTASQFIAIVQAFERLVQDNESAYAQSMSDIEKFLQRKSSISPPTININRTPPETKKEPEVSRAPISLHTDVVVTLKSLSVGCFPSSFSNSQILLAEALDAQARFAVALEGRRVHSVLGMELGQLRVALAGIPHSSATGPPKPVGEISIDEVVSSIRAARGGTILRVPKVIAVMQTWQEDGRNYIEYIFKSSFEGKVDVGWNLSRISFIRTMWGNHSRTLAARLGKPLPESTVQITTEEASSRPSEAKDAAKDETAPKPAESESVREHDKITAVVNMPQSRYEYRALEPPIIETPQLRDMGEATPPLEWIGLHRDRLPNVTHQIVIVTLLEIAKEVEDAYVRILGRS